MAKIECWYKQDRKKPVKVQAMNGAVFTLDNVGSLIGVEIYENGVPVDLTGSVNGYIILPDDTTVSVAGTRSGNKASINLPQSALAIPGIIKIAIKLTNSNEITTVLAVVATVARSRTDTIITPSSQIITDWSQQIAAEMQAVEDASAAQDAKISDLKLALNNTDELLHVGKIVISNFVQGTRYTSSPEIVREESTRITTARLYKVFSGDKVSFKNIASGCKLAIASDTGLDYRWISTDTTYTFAAEMRMYFVVAKNNTSEAISPSDFSAEIILNSKHELDLAEELLSLQNEIESNSGEIDDVETLLGSRYVPVFNELKYWGADYSETSTPSIRRKDNIIILDGTNSSDGTRRYAFGETVHVGQSESTLNGWTKDVHFVANHIYRIDTQKVSGSYSGDVSIRVRDSNNKDIITIGTAESKEICLSANTDVIPYLFIPVGSTFSQCKLSVTILDVTEIKKASEDTLTAISERLDTMNGVVKHWGADSVLPIWGTNDANTVGVRRFQSIYQLNGANGYGYRLRFSASGAITRLATKASVENLEKTIPFVRNHRYMLDVRILSGTYTSDYLAFILINESKTHIVDLELNQNENHYTAEFDWENAEKGLLYVEMGSTFTAVNGITFQIIFTEIVAEDFGDNADEIIKIQASRWLKNANISPVSILHFSDIHGDGTELKRIIDFYESNDGIIDSIICTGDMARAQYNSDFTFWSDTPGTENIMVAMGNHEYFKDSGSDHSKYEIAAQIQKWIGDYYTNWGVVRPSGASWYYKDYADAKVRLIVLDCNLTAEEGGTAQKAWLESVLADALTNEYAVIIATHYVYLKWQGYININQPFTNVFEQGQETGITYEWDAVEYITTVQDFIDDGGEFVCWISGHTHTDNLRYVKAGETVYDKQLDVVITAASPNHVYPITITTGDLPREAGTPTADAFNIVTVDTANKWLKITRVGSNVTTKMTYRDIMCYDYVSHQFLS